MINVQINQATLHNLIHLTFQVMRTLHGMEMLSHRERSPHVEQQLQSVLQVMLQLLASYGHLVASDGTNGLGNGGNHPGHHHGNNNHHHGHGHDGHGHDGAGGSHQGNGNGGNFHGHGHGSPPS